MKRILPKIIGLALIAGAASFVLAMIAKLLIGVAFIGLIAWYVKSRFSNRRSGIQQSFGDPRVSPGYFQSQQHSFSHTETSPFNTPKNNMAIIPIN
ncbi:MAG: hypothetical protein ABIX01_01620 [Chitinophagaceae bacterium]